MGFLRGGRRNGRGGLRRRGRGWRRVGSRGSGSDDFFHGGFADFAIAVVDATLRERVAAAAGAGFGVEFVERDGFLFRREFGKIHAGQLSRTIRVLQENLADILKRFHFDVADRQTEQRTNFGFVENGIAESFVLLHHAAFGIENEGSGQRGNPAVLNANVVRGQGNGIIDAESCSEFFDRVGIVVVHDKAEDLQPVFVLFLQFDKIGNFRAARPAPRGPEIHEDNFSFRACEGDGLAVEASELEIRRGIGIAHESDGGLIFLLSSRKERKEAKK